MNFKRITKKHNIILIAIMICCIGGCHFINKYDSKQAGKIEDEMRQLPLISAQDISDAIDSEEPKYYLFMNHQFDMCETVKDPSGKFAGDFLYLSYTAYKWKEEKRDKNGNIKQSEGWHYHDSDTKYGKLFLDKRTALDYFNSTTTFTDHTLNETTVNKDAKRYEYKYLSKDQKFTFVAKLGQNKAELGYKGAHVLAIHYDDLVQKTITEKKNTGAECFFFIICTAIAIFILQDMKKN